MGCVNNALFIELLLTIGQSHKLRVLIEAQYKCKCFDPLSMILISDTYNVLVTSLKPYIVHFYKWSISKLNYFEATFVTKQDTLLLIKSP